MVATACRHSACGNEPSPPRFQTRGVGNRTRRVISGRMEVGQRNGSKGMGTAIFFGFIPLPSFLCQISFGDWRGNPPPHGGGYRACAGEFFTGSAAGCQSAGKSVARNCDATVEILDFIGALGRTRTCNLLIRSQKLYPIELRTHPKRPARTGRPARITGRRVGSSPCFDKPRDVLVLRSRR